MLTLNFILSSFIFCINICFHKEFIDSIGLQVAEGYAPSLKKVILLHFLNVFQSKLYGQDHLVIAMQILILPMLAHTFQNEQSWEVVDAAVIKTIVEKLLDPPEEVVLV